MNIRRSADMGILFPILVFFIANILFSGTACGDQGLSKIIVRYTSQNTSEVVKISPHDEINIPGDAEQVHIEGYDKDYILHSRKVLDFRRDRFIVKSIEPRFLDLGGNDPNDIFVGYFEIAPVIDDEDIRLYLLRSRDTEISDKMADINNVVNTDGKNAFSFDRIMFMPSDISVRHLLENIRPDDMLSVSGILFDCVEIAKDIPGNLVSTTISAMVVYVTYLEVRR